MWIHVPGETQESVFDHLSAGKCGAADIKGIIRFERNPADTAAKSLESFFAHVSSYLNSGDAFNGAVFLMKDVGIGVLDENDQPVGDGNPWDLYAQLGEDRCHVHYWAVHTARGTHAAWTSIPKMSRFIHFSPCGHKFITMNIDGKGTPEEDSVSCVIAP